MQFKSSGIFSGQAQHVWAAFEGVVAAEAEATRLVISRSGRASRGSMQKASHSAHSSLKTIHRVFFIGRLEAPLAII